jgi:hypothetical protein
MRGIALGATAAALLVVAAVAFGAGGSATRLASSPPTLAASSEKSFSEHEHGQELLAYSGTLSGTGVSGDYRAKCLGLSGTTDGRVACDIVVKIGLGTLILQGLVKRPSGGLFATASDIQLAVTGGGGGYGGSRGYADVKNTPARLIITLMP